MKCDSLHKGDSKLLKDELKELAKTFLNNYPKPYKYESISCKLRFEKFHCCIEALGLKRRYKYKGKKL
jgi:hypothetical protein